jgi:hypothetical protein
MASLTSETPFSRRIHELRYDSPAEAIVKAVHGSDIEM